MSWAQRLERVFYINIVRCDIYGKKVKLRAKILLK